MAMRNILTSLLPLLFFVALYVGSGVYFTLQDVPNAFYQLSPSVAIIPAIMLAWVLQKNISNEHRITAFLAGVGHRDIISMCLIFMLAGAFTTVTQSIGSVDATINMTLSIIPQKFLLIGIFIASALISTAIGTSMGTIASIAPIASGLAAQGAFSQALGMATVIGGAMFGDNLSLVSDTTIAAVSSQEADYKAKFRINAIISCIAGAMTAILLFLVHNQTVTIEAKEFSPGLILPYAILIGLALSGKNVFNVLVISIVFAYCIGFLNSGYPFVQFSDDIKTGFMSMNEIMILSLLVGGLSGLTSGEAKDIAKKLGNLFPANSGKTFAQITIALVVSVMDVLLANNTVAIVMSGGIAKEVAHRCNIQKHYSAAWLDIFSCVVQGIIPYGAQILLASSIAGIRPLDVVPHVYYCYILGVVAIMFILFCGDKALRKTSA